MARYALREELSCCRIDGRLVLLDIERDRYFQLPPPLDAALSSHLQGATLPEHAAGALIAQQILTHLREPAPRSPPPFTPARRSAMESGVPAPRPGPLALAEVCALVLHVQWQLKRSPLQQVLARLESGRCTADPAGDTLPARAEQRLCAAAAVYRRARLYVPVEMRCLPDSLALLGFLHRRRCPARLVFGVALDPFSAHCWVQADDLVLNDTVGNVHAHTPIRVV